MIQGQLKIVSEEIRVKGQGQTVFKSITEEWTFILIQD